jgi:hypothetical protein
MAISRSSAERLCSGPELELVEASYPANAKQLSPARLQQKIQRARRLRDKYRDLAKQQRGRPGEMRIRSARLNFLPKSWTACRRCARRAALP